MLDEIRNQQGERLDFTFHSSNDIQNTLVVLGHGVTGNKDRPFLVKLAEDLSQAGFPVLRFSFSGNGASEGKFVDSTLSKEVEDLGAVLDHLDDFRICYAGHSMGSAVGVLRASRDKRIAHLISLAGMVHTLEFAQREFGQNKPGEGFMWDNPACPLSHAYLEDMQRVGSVLQLASQITVPWLFIHGDQDDVVPIQESQEIFALANEPKTFVELKNADHVFSGDSANRLGEEAAQWLKSRSH
jgi:uncharacterized protein